MKRIYLCGAHSTGKTTLSEQLGQRNHYLVCGESARIVLDSGSFNFSEFSSDAKMADKFQAEVARLHRHRHTVFLKEAFDNNHSGVVFDRGPDNLVYAALYSTRATREWGYSQDDIAFLKHEDARVFLIDPDEELIEDDGVRASLDMIDLWKITAGIQCLLEWNGIPYVRIQTPQLIERLKIIEGAVR